MNHFQKTHPQPILFSATGPYLYVRHPIYFFTLILIWATPVMTVDRTLFNLLWTLWIIYGCFLEEKDLLMDFGEAYKQYQEKTPMLIPWITQKKKM
jgi:protein-S-isoprenylcysteine O-methyltransferase Ste14